MRRVKPPQRRLLLQCIATLTTPASRAWPDEASREGGVLTHQGTKHEAKDRDGNSAPDVGAPADIALWRTLLALVEQLVDGEAYGGAHRQGGVC